MGRSSSDACSRWSSIGLAAVLWIVGVPVARAQQQEEAPVQAPAEGDEQQPTEQAPAEGDEQRSPAAGASTDAAAAGPAADAADEEAAEGNRPAVGSGEASSSEAGVASETDRAAAADGSEAAGEPAAPTSEAPAEPTSSEAGAAGDGASASTSPAPQEEPASGDRADEGSDGEEEADRDGVRGRVSGEFRLRLNLLGDIPLHTIERAGFPDRLGQNWWINQWLRLGASLSWGGTVELHAEVDVADGMLAGDPAQGVSAAARPRDGEELFPQGVVEPREFYLSWLSPIGQFRIGLQTSHWGLGILANDGAHEQPFGDYRFGDRVFRLLFATKPLGRSSDFYVALLGDLVYGDDIASLADGERALQMTLAAFYKKGEGREERSIGFYGVYRDQRRDAQDPAGETPRDLGYTEQLGVGVADVYARWTWDEPSGGTIFAAFEGALILGETNLTRTADREYFKVRQVIAAAQVGRLADDLDVVLEAGFTSGDSNAEDGYQRRGSMDPDHRVGLVLFPELLAAQTARAATLARSAELFARPQPGTDLLPTDGSVAGAWYLFPYAKWRPLGWLDARLGLVWARASSPVVDSFRQRAESRSVNFRGGDPDARDLGVEVDGALLTHFKLGRGIVASGGFEGGVLFPGHAFDDADGNGLGPLGMLRLRAGVRF